MNELIRVTFDNDRPTISGRELHEFLGIDTPYVKWFGRMVEYGFTDGESYWTILSNRSDGLAGKPRTDHQLTIEMAKELCMLQRNERGKQARQYFIQLEQDWNSPEKVMARALDIAHKQLTELRTENTALLAENEMQRQAIADFEPVRQYVDTILSSKDAVAITQIAADYGMSARQLNKILHEAGVQHKINDQWILYKKHMGKGLTVSRTIHFKRSDGRADTKINTCWTQKGRMMIHNLLTERGIVALMDRDQAKQE